MLAYTHVHNMYNHTQRETQNHTSQKHTQKAGGAQNKQAAPKVTSAKDISKDDHEDRQTGGSNAGNSNSKGKSHHATMRLGDLLLANLRNSRAAPAVAMPVPYTLKMKTDEKKGTYI